MLHRIIWSALLLSTATPVVLSHGAEKMKNCPRGCQCTSMNMVYMYCGFEEGFKRLAVFPSFIPLQVEVLSLYRNKITTIPEDALRNLTHLTTLNLRSNQLRDFPATVFRGLVRLRSLNIGFNKLSTLTGSLFDGLNNLQELYLDNNALESIPEELFQDLPTLKRLHLHYNRLKTFPGNAFRGTFSLQGLLLANNLLTNIHEETFSNLSLLSRLTLTDNRIVSLPVNVFKNLGSLAILKLENNNISTIEFRAFAGLKPGIFVLLNGNPFYCDCQLQWLKEWLRRRAKYVHSSSVSTTCSHPDRLRGKPLIYVADDQFSCIDGQWTEWSSWNTCSATCGSGTQLSRRRCTNTPPRSGKGCKGKSVRTKTCHGPECGAHWTAWSEWSECSKTCSFGNKVRTRHCQYLGTGDSSDSCRGSPKQIRVCTGEPCSIDGAWGSWSRWSRCSVTCSWGTRVRTRNCDKPRPQYGGKPCPETDRSIASEICYLGSCPVHGGWSFWTTWSKCSASCATGTRTRHRMCSNPVPQYDGHLCKGHPTQQESCNVQECPINGGWTSWSNWSDCSSSCSSGTQVRIRTCSNSMPQHDGQSCPGNSSDIRYCNPGPCPIHGQWTTWSHWNECTKTCDNGTRFRIRTCSNPSPRYGGQNCTGNSSNVRHCNRGPCPVHGQWGTWSLWSACSQSCANGTQSRNRTCSNPSPQHGGKKCQGNASDLRLCNLGPCPVHGQWTPWSVWTMCSQSCANGTQSRNRTCSNPSPQHGGKKCQGNASDLRLCNLGPSPVHGQWTPWSVWTMCSQSCANGTQSRNRTCSNPSPQHGGKKCQGNASDLRLCNLGPSPVHGQWTPWSLWSACSQSCANGTQSRNRTCSNPSPQHGGKKCQGNASDLRLCNLGPCPVHGQWTPWSLWSACSQSCANGTQSRNRTCNNPSPQHGGQNCSGNGSDPRPCIFGPCPVHGQWTPWSVWTTCSQSCANGTQSRHRTCSNPSPQHGGQNCSGNASDPRPCNLAPCPVHGQWTTWSVWTTCSQSCAYGTQNRNRTCSNPPPQHGGHNCSGNASDRRYCNPGPCPVHGQWTTWSFWSECSQSCANGTKSRNRTCSNPSPKFGGTNCSGKETEVKGCKLESCPINGKWSGWSQWSDCSRSCSRGTKSRTRTCSRPFPSHGGESCVGNSTDKEMCQVVPCPVHGGWGQWSNWTDCSTICGNGTQSRYRNCTNPLPQHGETYCSGDSNQSKHCFVQRCPVVGQWTEWSNWTDCSKTCALGQQTRTRSCRKSNITSIESAINKNGCSGKETVLRACDHGPCPDHGVRNAWSPWSPCSVSCGLGKQQRSMNCKSRERDSCLGSRIQIKSCYQSDCPVDGGWSSWSNWTECSSSCGTGFHAKFRFCTNPMPQGVGDSCHGKNVMYKDCKVAECTYQIHQNDSFWSSWTKWSQCSATCSRGHRTRSRYCRKQLSPFHLGNCTGATGPVQVESNICEIQPCIEWSAWSSWTACSQSCGDGIQTRVRTCQNQANGMTCKGDNSQTVSCNANPCPPVIPPITYPPKIDLGLPNTCPDPEKPLHGHYKITNQGGSYFTTYYCKKHYNVHGPRLRHCESDGTWSDYVPYCLPVCGESSLSYMNAQHQRLRIFGGGTSPRGQWPWQVALTVNGLFQCGGSLIAEDWIVTAAHCVYHRLTKKRYSRFKVYLGVHDISSRLKDPNVQTIYSRDIVPHPNFNWSTFDSDLALIQLRWRANITDYVRPVCLPNKQQRRKVTLGAMGVMLGWGLTEKDSPSSELRQVSMPVVAHSICQKAYEKEDWPVTSNMLCAGDAHSAKDSCKSDSGGGLLFPDPKNNKKKWFLGGIISWGNPKCGTPGKFSVFTHINSKFSKWIKNYIYN